jgi:ferritin
MINKKLEAALNKQINEEMFSAYLYLSMAAYFQQLNLGGFASWMKVQAQEEMSHAMKFFHFLEEMEGQVSLKAIQEPESKWPSPLAAFAAALKHERHITGRINDLYRLSLAESCYPMQIMLQWFIKEQVEEEATAAQIVHELTQVKDSPQGLWMINRELGARKTS